MVFPQSLRSVAAASVAVARPRVAVAGAGGARRGSVVAARAATYLSRVHTPAAILSASRVAGSVVGAPPALCGSQPHARGFASRRMERKWEQARREEERLRGVAPRADDTPAASQQQIGPPFPLGQQDQPTSAGSQILTVRCQVRRDHPGMQHREACRLATCVGCVGRTSTMPRRHVLRRRR